jgi:hypothetical protein
MAALDKTETKELTSTITDQIASALGGAKAVETKSEKKIPAKQDTIKADLKEKVMQEIFKQLNQQNTPEKCTEDNAK